MDIVITPRSQALEAALRWGGPGMAARSIVDAAGMFLDFLEGRPLPVVGVDLTAKLNEAQLEAYWAAKTPAEESAALGVAPTKRTRRTKAEMEAARAAEATPVEQAIQATTEPPPPAPAAEEPPPPPATFADAKAAMTRVVETNGLGVAAAVDLLKKFNVARLSQLEEGQWTGFVLACETAVKGAAA